MMLVIKWAKFDFDLPPIIIVDEDDDDDE